MWPFQPELNNEVFDDDLEVVKGLAGKVSPRQEYMNLAAVPRFSRPSMELQVASTTLGAVPSVVWAVCLASVVVGGCPERCWVLLADCCSFF